LEVALSLPVAEVLMTLKDDAVVLHETFVSLVDAGFTEDQAIKIIVGLISYGQA
jgi:hypothetical protein